MVKQNNNDKEKTLESWLWDAACAIREVPDKWFSGYHILAYYYVSWALAMPGKVQELQLPFDREFELAKQMKQEKK